MTLKLHKFLDNKTYQSFLNVVEEFNEKYNTNFNFSFYEKEGKQPALFLSIKEDFNIVLNFDIENYSPFNFSITYNKKLINFLNKKEKEIKENKNEFNYLELKLVNLFFRLFKKFLNNKVNYVFLYKFKIDLQDFYEYYIIK